jgi:hypothetical protein
MGQAGGSRSCRGLVQQVGVNQPLKYSSRSRVGPPSKPSTEPGQATPRITHAGESPDRQVAGQNQPANDGPALRTSSVRPSLPHQRREWRR